MVVLKTQELAGIDVTATAAYPIWADTRTVDEFLCPGTGAPGVPPAVLRSWDEAEAPCGSATRSAPCRTPAAWAPPSARRGGFRGSTLAQR